MKRRFVVLSLCVLSAVLILSLFFSVGVPGLSKFSLNTFFGGQPTQGGASVFVDPSSISKDYVNDSGYQIGDKFTVNVNISDVTDLFTWQVNVTWNHQILNFTEKVTYGDFLYRTTSPDKTSRTTPIVGGNNVTGDGWAAETILGNYAGISGAGRLVSMEFQVVGYGWTEINISTAGILPTTLLNSAGSAIPFVTVNGWFDNRIRGDSDGNGIVSLADVGEISDRWTSPPGLKPYARYVDWDNNGVISVGDAGAVSDNWGRFKP